MKYVEGVMNYTGSKFKMLSQILPEMDYKKNTFVDAFCGGGSVYINVVDRYKKIIVNDIIKDLIGIHKELVDSDDIVTRTKFLCPGKKNPEGYAELRNSYNENPTPDKLWALMLSSTNNMVRFNQKFKFNQTYGDRGFSDATQKKVDNFTKHIREYKENLVYLSTQFDKIEIDSDMMIYCDPPYSNTNAGYNAYWKKDDDEKLYNYIKNIDSIGASFMLSGTLEHNGEKCKLLEDLINDGFRYKILDFNYNKVSKVGKKNTKEIIIMNY